MRRAYERGAGDRPAGPCSFAAHLARMATPGGPGGAEAAAPAVRPKEEVKSEAARSKEEVKLKRTKPRSFDLRSGEELCYASSDALKAHWPSVPSREWGG